jgi:prepilin signal peptidase PulO-like enzyme (type II secretory pathway)
MFCPIQSIAYTWNTSKKLYEVFAQYSLKSRCLIVSSASACFALISIYLSVGLGILFCLFAWICLIDMYDRIVPDILLVGILLNLWIIQIAMHADSFAIAAVLLCLKLAMESWYKKPLIGWGDMKLIALCLTFIPLESTPFLLFISGIIGLIIAFITRSHALPFAPCIIAGFLSVFTLY